MQVRSPNDAERSTGFVFFPTASNSPVNAASCTCRFFTFIRRTSAGTLSPDSTQTRSPGTSDSAAIACRRPSRNTLACSDSILRIASSARSAFPSCKKPISALMMTTPRITPVSTQCCMAAVIAAEARST